jgi:glycosyltransferase involved in cell wall biosynthesis
VRKFLFISNQYHPNVIGGAELTVQTLAQELMARGYAVCIVSLSPGKRDSVDVVNGARVYRLAVANLYTPFKEPRSFPLRALWHLADIFNPIMARKVGAILDAEKPDWVSAHNLGGFSVSVWSAVKSRGLGLSQVLHDYYAMCPKTTMSRAEGDCETRCGLCRAFTLPKQLLSSQPDVVIGVSRFVLMRHLQNGYFPNVASGVVYNGRPFTPPPLEHLRKPGSPLQIGFIGRIQEIKGIATLFEAVSRLPPHKWKLRVAGRAPDPAYLDKLRQQYPLPQIEYLGYVNSDEFYKSVDLVVIPSEWHEPMPGVVYEPLGWGVPVVASRVGGIPEILDGADCGWLFEPRDAAGLSARLEQLIDGWPDPEGMRRRAVARRALFTPERQADAFLALIGN